MNGLSNNFGDDQMSCQLQLHSFLSPLYGQTERGGFVITVQGPMTDVRKSSIAD